MRSAYTEYAAWLKLRPNDRASIIGGIGFTLIVLVTLPNITPILTAVVLVPLYFLWRGVARWYRFERKIRKGELFDD